MIYLISQISFIFLTQIYYDVSFITLSSIWSHYFSGTLRSIFVNCFWRTFFAARKKCIFLNVCKIWLKELGILLKRRETFEKFSAACNSSKNTGIPHIFFIGFWQLYFKNINFLKKTKGTYHADFYEFKTKMNGKDKQNYIFQKSKSYEIFSIYIYIYIYIYWWGPGIYSCILLVYPIRPWNLY